MPILLVVPAYVQNGTSIGYSSINFWPILLLLILAVPVVILIFFISRKSKNNLTDTQQSDESPEEMERKSLSTNQSKESYANQDSHAQNGLDAAPPSDTTTDGSEGV